MKPARILPVALVTVSLIGGASLRAQAQHSTGDTPASVTEATGGGTEQQSGASGAGMGGSHGETGSANQGHRMQPDTPKQAGSQGQQGMKSGGTPMEQDKGSDTMIHDEGKRTGKK